MARSSLLIWLASTKGPSLIAYGHDGAPRNNAKACIEAIIFQFLNKCAGAGAPLAHCSIYFETNASNSFLDLQIVSFSCNVGFSSQLSRYSFPPFVSWV